MSEEDAVIEGVAATSAPVENVPASSNTAEAALSAATAAPAITTAPTSPTKAEQRQASVYTASALTVDPKTDFDEDIYEMSTGRAQAYQNLLTNKSRKLTEGGPMLTKELRRKQEAESRANILKCEVRIRFPDQSQLLSTFKATETIGDVMTFVRFSLADPMIPFYFFVTPPRRILRDPRQMLVSDLHFGSREIIYFAWDLEKIEEQLGSGYKLPTQALRPEVLQQAQDISTMKTFESEPKEEEEDKKMKPRTLGGSGPAGRVLGAGGPSKLTKPPAWMKLGRK
ncbi:uncharacterized protein V1518DRAFT_409991 [Limtongia smithiae]|uniref:uncharacterized protein n=1 Tax=Limtongia smithiae TaxID=1125753 RepID=UPI0034CE5A41